MSSEYGESALARSGTWEGALILDKGLFQSPELLPDILVSLKLGKSPNNPMGKLDSPVPGHNRRIECLRLSHEDVPKDSARLVATKFEGLLLGRVGPTDLTSMTTNGFRSEPRWQPTVMESHRLTGCARSI